MKVTYNLTLITAQQVLKKYFAILSVLQIFSLVVTFKCLSEQLSQCNNSKRKKLKQNNGLYLHSINIFTTVKLSHLSYLGGGTSYLLGYLWYWILNHL